MLIGGYSLAMQDFEDLEISRLEMKTGFFPLLELDRPALIAHFLQLSGADRRLRFNVCTSCETIRSWGSSLNLSVVSGFFSFGKLVAVVMLCPEEPGSAEFAVSVDESRRGTGLATTLLDEAIRHQGLHKVVIRHGCENVAMARVHRGFPSVIRREFGEVDVVIDARQVRRDEMAARAILCAAEA